MFRFALLLLLPLAACLSAPPAPKEPLAQLLEGRRVAYQDAESPGQRQVWQADGTTTYYPSAYLGFGEAGRWRVEDGRYCSIFGEQQDWTCWRVETPAQGRIRFTEIPKGRLGPELFGLRRFEGAFID
ncbi:MAG: hypothetical protein QM656_15035 [Paracoccaceae bacterium]